MSSQPCHLLEWDTEFFGFRVARVSENRLHDEDVEEVKRWCAAERIRCLYLLAASGDAATTRVAEEHGFHLTDVRVTLERRLDDAPAANPALEPAAEGDIAELRRIAAASHGDSRFYFDLGFPRPSCDGLFAAWIEKSCRGYAQAVLVARQGSRPAGYVTCHLRDTTGQIGLIAVDRRAQGQGLGRDLVNASLGLFQERGMTRAIVVTQGRNVASQRLYQRCGFVTSAVELWYHRWFKENPVEWGANPV